MEPTQAPTGGQSKWNPLLHIVGGTCCALVGACLSIYILLKVALFASKLATWEVFFAVIGRFGLAWLTLGIIVGFSMGFPSLRRKIGLLRLTTGWIILTFAFGAYVHDQLQDPQFYIGLIAEVANGGGVEDEDDGTVSRCNARLGAMGNRAIEPVLDQIDADQRGPGNDLDDALEELGPPAHRRLLQKIDIEQEDWKRVICIVAIQDAFGDYSHLPILLNMARDTPEEMSDFRLDLSIQKHFGQDVPIFFTEDRRLSPAFIHWYHTKSGPGGPLPPWKM